MLQTGVPAGLSCYRSEVYGSHRCFGQDIHKYMIRQMTIHIRWYCKILCKALDHPSPSTRPDNLLNTHHQEPRGNHHYHHHYLDYFQSHLHQYQLIQWHQKGKHPHHRQHHHYRHHHHRHHRHYRHQNHFDLDYIDQDNYLEGLLVRRHHSQCQR